MVEMAFKADVPGATAFDRLKYLRDLLHEFGLDIVERNFAPDHQPELSNIKTGAVRPLVFGNSWDESPSSAVV
ncbi:hypothetical protein ACQR1I_20675 [Bradyrhizobium sp. HKCCYLS2038]|uniref:hypothetical protein n=1 Tax=unclassified Bradyrhizobium TaxID=2631580 RepID=UPI003EBF5A18